MKKQTVVAMILTCVMSLFAPAAFSYTNYDAEQSNDVGKAKKVAPAKGSNDAAAAAGQIQDTADHGAETL